MRSICAALLMILVVKEGSCRHPGRTVPWPALVSPADATPVMGSDNPEIKDKMPEPPKGHGRDRRFAPWARQTVAQVPQIPGGMQDLPQIPGGGVPQMPPMPQLPESLPPMQIPSGRRRRRSPKEDKKDGKKKERKPEEKPQAKPEEMKEAKEKQ